jgi:hypothetical protein
VSTTTRWTQRLTHYASSMHLRSARRRSSEHDGP